MTQRNFLAQQGFLTFAFGTEYLRLAYLQAMSIKLTQKVKNYAVVVDKLAAEDISKYHHAFDKVITIDYEAKEWDMSKHYMAFSLSPWKETVFVESDILFNESIDHWWSIMRLKDVCLTNSVKDFRENTITSRKHRKLFDENLLPDVYSGFVYFKYSEFANEFFNLIKFITFSWDWIAKEHLIKNEDNRIRSDEIFALATRIVGIHNVTLPVAIPTFVHGKGDLWRLSETQPWYEQLFSYWDNCSIIIGHYKQRLPLHYFHKEWITDDVIRYYEYKFAESTNCSTEL